jgi:hypothetical protein
MASSWDRVGGREMAGEGKVVVAVLAVVRMAVWMQTDEFPARCGVMWCSGVVPGM